MPGRGDDASQHRPLRGRASSAYFMSLNRGKESIALDLDDDARSRRVFEKLLARADVLAENFGRGALERLGYGWDDRPPASSRGWSSLPRRASARPGPTPARPAYDIVVQAMGGIMSLTGVIPAARPPAWEAPIGDITAGLFTAIGVLAALHSRGERSGERDAGGRGDARRPGRHPRERRGALRRHRRGTGAAWARDTPRSRPSRRWQTKRGPRGDRRRQRRPVRRSCARPLGAPRSRGAMPAFREQRSCGRRNVDELDAAAGSPPSRSHALRVRVDREILRGSRRSVRTSVNDVAAGPRPIPRLPRAT